MKRAAVFLFVFCAASAAPAQIAGTQGSRTPVLVELFTSEGCSSCPPADAWLAKMDAAQPVAGEQLIVLSEHVDYWDHDGWKDPYSAAQFTERQSSYAHAMGLGTVYTPQVIANGRTELRLDQPQKMGPELAKAAASATLPISISAVSIDEGYLTAHVAAGPGPSRRSGEVFAAIALNHAETQVAHGENGGRLLKHAAVVEELVQIGKLDKGETFNHDIRIKIRADADPKNLRLVVFAQEPEMGAVLGAALQVGVAGFVK